MTSIETLDEAIAELHRISQALGIEDRFKPFSHRFYREIKKIHHRYHGKVLYFIWKNPWMIAGSRTFIHSWLEYLGFENIGATFPGRYPQLTEDQIRNLKADIIFLSSEPYKFKEEDTMELQKLFGDQKQPIMKPVDGRYFIWYGYKMLEAIDYFRKVL
jgi:ABC-type Fe3+-hydroxamate transport system substrate-binding protein